jgi:hypothetical protein
MKYTKPQLLNVTQASSAIMGGRKEAALQDHSGGPSTINAYQSDE